MKKLSVLLTLALALIMLLSAIPAQATGIDEKPTDDYDKYGYYARFDFENVGAASMHNNYFKSAGAKNENGLACNPFGFYMGNMGNPKGTGEFITDGDNGYYRYTYSADGDNDLIAAFTLQTADGKNMILADSAELNFKFRMADTQPETIAADQKLPIVNVRRGDPAKDGGSHQHIFADIYGNIYANINGKNVKVYTNPGDGTVGGDGEFIEVSFKWYDTLNVYSLYVNGKAVAEAIPLRYDFRSTNFVTQTYDDDFAVASRTVVGGSTTGNTAGGDRCIEIGRGNKGFIAEYDDIELRRIETAQGGAYYYYNGFDSDNNAIASHITSSSYGYRNASYMTLGAKDANGNGVLNIKSDSWFALNDQPYQQLTQGNTVYHFRIKGTATHTSGLKSLISIRDSAGVNLYKLLSVASDGSLYIGDKEKEDLRINDYKLDGSEWLDIAIVAIKNTDNNGKFGPFTSNSGSNSYKNYYFFNYYINGNYVGTNGAEYKSWIKNGVWSTGKPTTASNHSYSTVDYTIGGDVAALDLTKLTLVDNITTANHEIWKGTNADGATVYYDITFNENKEQTAYSAMTLSAAPSGLEEAIRFFTDPYFNLDVDYVKVYAGTAPDYVYEGANAKASGEVLNVDFASTTFAAGNATSRTHASGSNVLGSVVTNNVNASNLSHKDANGAAVSASNTRNSEYSTVTFNESSWFDLFVPMPKSTDGNYDFEYSYETEVKNISFGSAGAPSTVFFFSHRFENDNGNKAIIMMSVKSDLTVWAGANMLKLYNADGSEAKIDNGNWNALRHDVHFTKNADGVSIEVSYFLNDQILFLSDGSTASAINISSILSEQSDKELLLDRFGTSNYRLRYINEIASGKTLNMDIKSINISKKAPDFSYVSADAEGFAGNVSVFELEIPSYTADDKYGYHSVMSLEKTDYRGDCYKQNILIANIHTGALSIEINGERTPVLRSNGNPVDVSGEATKVAVIYDDIEGDVRMYVNGQPAYYNNGGSITLISDLVIAEAFAAVDGIVDEKVIFFGGLTSDTENALSAEDYKLKLDVINSKDGAELIGLQSNGLTKEIRAIVGLDSLYYSTVGFEMETFVGGVSSGVKDLSANIVYSSIIDNDKTITAESQGYNYLAAVKVTEPPKSYEENTYIVIRSYTEVGGNKHYDDAVELVLTNDGYYFNNEGYVYQNNFGGLSALPTDWVLVGDGTATLTNNCDILISETNGNDTYYYLDHFVGKEYTVQTDVAIEDNVSEDSYLALVFGYNKEAGTFGKAVISCDGTGAIMLFNGEAWTTATEFALDYPLKADKPYTLTLICKAGEVALFVDGELAAKTAIEDNYNMGKVGVLSSGVSFSFDNFIVREADPIEEDYTIYEQSFTGYTSLPENWKVFGGNANSSFDVLDGTLNLVQPDGAYMVTYLDQDLGTNDYVIEADVKVTYAETGQRYFGFVYRYTNSKSFVTAGIRMSGAQGWLEAKTATGWNTFDNTVSFTDQNGKVKPIELDRTYSIALICKGMTAYFYIDGQLVGSGTIPEGYESGKVGLYVSGVNVSVDNFVVYPIDRAAKIERVAYDFYNESASEYLVPTEWSSHFENGGKAVIKDDNLVTTVGNVSSFIVNYLNAKDADGNFIGYNSTTGTNDYVVKAKFTINGYDTDQRYIGLTLRYQTFSKRIETGLRLAGKNSTGTSGGWVEFDGVGGSITIPVREALEKGKQYTFTGICKGNQIWLYIDDELLASGTIPAGLETGTVGMISKGVNYSLDQFDVYSVTEDGQAGELIYSQPFDSIIPSEFTVINTNTANNKITKDENGKLVYDINSASYVKTFLNKDIGYNPETGTNDYVIDLKVNIHSWQSGNMNMGIYFRQQTNAGEYGNNPASEFVYAAIRTTGRRWIQGQNTGNNWGTPGGDTDPKLKKGINTLKVICVGNTAKFYVNGELLIEGPNPSTKNPKQWSTGIVGFGSYGVNFTLEEFKVSEYILGVTDVYYEQSFDNGIELPSDWATANTGSNAKVEIADYSKIEVKNYADNFLQTYLNTNVKKDGVDVFDYTVEAEIKITAIQDTARYIGLLLRKSSSNYVFAALRQSGAGWIQGNNSSTYEYGTFNLADVAEFNGDKLVAGQTYKFKATCQGDTVKFYIDDVLVCEGTNPVDAKIAAGSIDASKAEVFDKGTVGMASKGINYDILSFKVTSVPAEGETAETLVDYNFGKISNLSDGWSTAKTDSSKGLTATLVYEGKLKLNSTTTGSILQAYLDIAFANPNYVVEADVTVNNRGNYFGIVGRKTSANFVYSGIYSNRTANQNGYGWIQGNNSGTYDYIGEKFNLADHGITMAPENTYKLKAIFDGDKVDVYVNDVLVASGTNPTDKDIFDTGTVGVGIKNLDIEIDNFTVRNIRNTSGALYVQDFNSGGTNLPEEWKNNESSAGNGVTPSIGIMQNAYDQTQGSLHLKAMDSTLSVIAIDRLFEYDNFVYEMDVTMLGRNTEISGLNNYMGPVFGLQEDGSCAMANLSVADGKWNVEAWLTSNQTNPEDGSNWISFGGGALTGGTKENTLYRFKIVAKDGFVSFYVNGQKLTTCAVDDPFLDGKFGIVFKNADILVDNVKLEKIIDKYEITNAKVESTVIRVAQFNLGDFSTASDKSGDGIPDGNGTEVTKKEYRNVFKRVSADAWGLQEDSKDFSGTTKESPYDAIYSTVLPNYERNFTGTYNGKAFLSHYDIYDVEAVYYPATKTSYSNNPSYSHAWFLAGKIMVDGKEVTLITLHFDWGCKELRRVQIDTVINYAKQQDYCVIIGDFNPENCVAGKKVEDENDPDYVNGYESKNMYQVDWKIFTDAGFKSANGGEFDPLGTIVRKGVAASPHPWDNVFVTPNIKIVDMEVITESWMNDHAIVMADIELN